MKEKLVYCNKCSFHLIFLALNCESIDKKKKFFLKTNLTEILTCVEAFSGSVSSSLKHDPQGYGAASFFFGGGGPIFKEEYRCIEESL